MDTTELENRAGLLHPRGQSLAKFWLGTASCEGNSIWVSTSATRKTKRNGISHKLEVDNASHVLFTQEVEDKFVGLAVKEYDHDDANTYITVFASTRTQILPGIFVWAILIRCSGQINGETYLHLKYWHMTRSMSMLDVDMSRK